LISGSVVDGDLRKKEFKEGTVLKTNTEEKRKLTKKVSKKHIWRAS